MRSLSALGIVAIASFTNACSRDVSSVMQPTAVSAFASQGAPDIDSRLRIDYHAVLSDNVTAARIRGDNRAADGSAASTEFSSYQGDVCGVHGKIFWYDLGYSHSGDAVFHPDGTAHRCGAARYLTFDFGAGPVALSPFTNAKRVMQLAVNEARSQDMRYNVGLPSCSYLMFEGSNQVLVTRTDQNTDPVAARTWMVETQGAHTGTCYVKSKGSYRQNGSPYLPFRATITEIPNAG